MAAGRSVFRPLVVVYLDSSPPGRETPLGPYFGDLAGGLVSEHALTRTVRDSAALLDATSGPDIGDPYYAPAKERPFLDELKRDAGSLKIGFLTSAPEGWGKEPQVHPDCINAVKDAARLCEDLGHSRDGFELRPEGLVGGDLVGGDDDVRGRLEQCRLRRHGITLPRFRPFYPKGVTAPPNAHLGHQWRPSPPVSHLTETNPTL